MNKRDDYLAVALRNTPCLKNIVFQTHWNEVLKNRVWVSADGTEYKFEEIDDSHLRSIIKMLIRFDDKSANKLIIEFIKLLMARNKF